MYNTYYKELLEPIKRNQLPSYYTDRIRHILSLEHWEVQYVDNQSNKRGAKRGNLNKIRWFDAISFRTIALNNDLRKKLVCTDYDMCEVLYQLTLLFAYMSYNNRYMSINIQFHNRFTDRSHANLATITVYNVCGYDSVSYVTEIASYLGKKSIVEMVLSPKCNDEAMFDSLMFDYGNTIAIEYALSRKRTLLELAVKKQHELIPKLAEIGNYNLLLGLSKYNCFPFLRDNFDTIYSNDKVSNRVKKALNNYNRELSIDMLRQDIKITGKNGNYEAMRLGKMSITSSPDDTIV